MNFTQLITGLGLAGSLGLSTPVFDDSTEVLVSSPTISLLDGQSDVHVEAEDHFVPAGIERPQKTSRANHSNSKWKIAVPLALLAAGFGTLVGWQILRRRRQDNLELDTHPVLPDALPVASELKPEPDPVPARESQISIVSADQNTETSEETERAWQRAEALANAEPAEAHAVLTAILHDDSALAADKLFTLTRLYNLRTQPIMTFVRNEHPSIPHRFTDAEMSFLMRVGQARSTLCYYRREAAYLISQQAYGDERYAGVADDILLEMVEDSSLHSENRDNYIKQIRDRSKKERAIMAFCLDETVAAFKRASYFDFFSNQDPNHPGIYQIATSILTVRNLRASTANKVRFYVRRNETLFDQATTRVYQWATEYPSSDSSSGISEFDAQAVIAVAGKEVSAGVEPDQQPRIIEALRIIVQHFPEQSERASELLGNLGADDASMIHQRRSQTIQTYLDAEEQRSRPGDAFEPLDAIMALLAEEEQGDIRSLFAQVLEKRATAFAAWTERHPENNKMTRIDRAQHYAQEILIGEMHHALGNNQQARESFDHALAHLPPQSQHHIAAAAARANDITYSQQIYYSIATNTSLNKAEMGYFVRLGAARNLRDRQQRLDTMISIAHETIPTDEDEEQIRTAGFCLIIVNALEQNGALDEARTVLELLIDNTYIWDDVKDKARKKLEELAS